MKSFIAIDSLQATSHHLPSRDAYGKYDVGLNREMEGQETILREFEKKLIGGMIQSQMRVRDTVSSRD